MKNLKKVLVVVLALVFTLTFCTACGGSDSSDGDKTIKVAATPAPHAEILEEVKDVLAEDGWTLEVTVFEDYVNPAEAVVAGDCDANYFAHWPYIDDYNKKNETEMVNAGAIHYEPLGLYKSKCQSLDDVKEGIEILVPNDTSNEARALMLLEANGLIKLREGFGVNVSELNLATDIVENKLNIKITELEAVTIPSALPDADLAVINGNYAIGAGLTADDALAFEDKDSEAATTFANIVVCNAGNENSDKIQALVKALQTDAVKKFIEEKYQGSVQVSF